MRQKYKVLGINGNELEGPIEADKVNIMADGSLVFIVNLPTGGKTEDGKVVVMPVADVIFAPGQWTNVTRLVD